MHMYLCSNHHEIHTFGASVNVEEALKTMALLRQRLVQTTTDIQKAVSSTTKSSCIIFCVLVPPSGHFVT